MSVIYNEVEEFLAAVKGLSCIPRCKLIVVIIVNPELMRRYSKARFKAPAASCQTGCPEISPV